MDVNRRIQLYLTVMQMILKYRRQHRERVKRHAGYIDKDESQEKNVDEPETSLLYAEKRV